MRVVVLLGAPGAGKGTAAAIVERSTNFRQLSTGNILREAMREGTALGRQVAEHLDSGRLVPDGTVLDVVHEQLTRGDGPQNYLFDGFPRTQVQAELLDVFLRREFETSVERVFYLEIAAEQVIRRLLGRLSCERCGAVYHRERRPPAVEGVCDFCGGALKHRGDDTEETIKARLEVFEQQTSGLIAYYQERGMLYRLDASGEAEAVAKEMLKVLGLDGEPSDERA